MTGVAMIYVICIALVVYAAGGSRYERVAIAAICAYLLIALIGKLSGGVP